MSNNAEITKNDADSKAFGSYLTRMMEEKNMTQAELAELARTTQPTISFLRNGVRQCSMKLALRLADALTLNGEERVRFLSKANQPRWKGFCHETFGGEAMFSETVVQLLAATGVKTTDIATVTLIDHLEGKPTAILVMKDGEVYDIGLEIQKRTSEISIKAQSPTPPAPPETPTPTAPCSLPDTPPESSKPVDPIQTLEPVQPPVPAESNQERISVEPGRAGDVEPILRAPVEKTNTPVANPIPPAEQFPTSIL